MSRFAIGIAAMAFAAAVTSCQHTKGIGQSASQSPGADLPAVPPAAPDSISSSLIDSLGVISAGHGPPWVRRIIDVAFLDHTPLSQRVAAIRAVNGRVVGGYKWPVGEGDYFVLVPDSTPETMIAAMDKLASMPGVEYAGPLVPNDVTNDGIQRGDPHSHR